jgi:hypothetical protein
VHVHAADALAAGELEQRREVAHVAVHAAVGDEADQVQRALAPALAGL